MWVKVAKISDIEEGAGKTVIANGKEIAVFKKDDAVYAMENSCPHRGGPLGEGYVDGLDVTCPWHAWSFDLKTGECRTMPEFKQPVFPAKMEGEDVWVDA